MSSLYGFLALKSPARINLKPPAKTTTIFPSLRSVTRSWYLLWATVSFRTKPCSVPREELGAAGVREAVVHL